MRRCTDNQTDTRARAALMLTSALALVVLAIPTATRAQSYPAGTRFVNTAPGTTYVTAPAATTRVTASRTYVPTTYTYAQPAAAAAAPTYAAGGDAYGFTSWLNGVRAQHGLPAVSFDANLAGWAASNNAQQAFRGLGHFVMGPARRQNSAMGSAASIGMQWFNSPAHRALLLDPTIRSIGLAGSGQYWTLNAR